MLKKSFIAIISMLLYSIVIVPRAMAVVEPTFPLCVNPQGSLKVEYSKGTHGIAGSSVTYTGSDAVYTLSDGTLMQCYCADDGTGIQTNWWRADHLSQRDIDVLKSLGWILVPTGLVWGLDDAPYLARNSNYACTGGTGGGQVQSATATKSDILGLASTGNIATIYAFFTSGALMTGFGLMLRKKA